MRKKLLDDWTKIGILAFAIILYTITFLMDPSTAKASVNSSLKEIRKLFIPLLIAIFAGTTVKTLITPELVKDLFDGKRGILTAGTVGSLLPPCPFVSYPAIKGFNDGGLKLPAFMTMLTTTTTVEVGQLFCGLAVFGSMIVGVRILFAFLAAMIIGTLFFLIHARFLPSSFMTGKEALEK